MTINLHNGFEAIYDDGEWLYKAIPFSVNKKVVEKPLYKVIEEIEEEYNKEFERALVGIVKNVTKLINL